VAQQTLEKRVCSSLPPLDPNDQPFSFLLRGAAADLGDLRFILSSHREELQQLLLELNGEDDREDNNIYGDVTEVEESKQTNSSSASNCDQVVANTEQSTDNQHNSDETANNKRTRDEENNEEDEDCDDELEESLEELLLYLPSVSCTCSSWKMKDIQGDLLITSLRVLFLSDKQTTDTDGEHCYDNDIAIDGRFIALHAVDSLPSSTDANEIDANEINVAHHVYCQLAEPMGDDDGDGIGYTPISAVAPTQITEEDIDNKSNSDNNDDEDESIDTLEVFFKPTTSDESNCQSIFDALTKLITLTGDSDDGFGGGGGLFNMMSLMAGIGGNGNDDEMVVANHYDNESDDEMVVRYGGSNNLVQDNDNESDGVPDEERQAMLRRLDDMLVVPPEYEIASTDDDEEEGGGGGQFSDASFEVDAIL